MEADLKVKANHRIRTFVGGQEMKQAKRFLRGTTSNWASSMNKSTIYKNFQKHGRQNLLQISLYKVCGAVLCSCFMSSEGSGNAVHFNVELEPLQPWEYVFVCGSSPELGSWQTDKSLKLRQHSSGDEMNTSHFWRGNIELAVKKSLEFRYFIGYYLVEDQDSEPDLQISKWESFQSARSIKIDEINSCQDFVTNHTFGVQNGQRLVSDGWLTSKNQNEVFLRINGDAFVYFDKAHMRGNYQIKVTPFDVRHKEVFDYRQIGSQVCRKNSIHQISREGYMDDEDGSGVCQLPLYSSFSVAHLAILSDEAPLFREQPPFGETFDMIHYTIIKPIMKEVPFNTMEKSYSRHWKKLRTIEVGHRGMGNSYTKVAADRENTISSLNRAANNGADFVEFDVQLSKDKIALIFHDFHVLVNVAKRISSVQDGSMNEMLSSYHEIAIKDLNLQQLQLLRLEHKHINCVSKPRGTLKLSADANESVDDHPFPTLVEALQRVVPAAGFNIEIKYPMMQENGEHECENYFDRNQYIDIVLNDVLMHANGRRILFSSFDPDICALLSAKQRHYPVLLLCIGKTTRYENFADIRVSSSITAVNFAAGLQFLGVNFHSEDLLYDPSPLYRAKKLGLISFVWGDDLNCRERIDYFKKQLCVNGLVYDRIDELCDVGRETFLIGNDAKSSIFDKSGVSTTVSCTSVEEISVPSTSPIITSNLPSASTNL